MAQFPAMPGTNNRRKQQTTPGTEVEESGHYLFIILYYMIQLHKIFHQM